MVSRFLASWVYSPADGFDQNKWKAEGNRLQTNVQALGGHQGRCIIDERGCNATDGVDASADFFLLLEVFTQPSEAWSVEVD